MTARLKPYQRMKRSGIELLGDIPKHWDVRRLRNVANIQFSNVDKHSKDDELSVRLCNYSDVYHNDRIRSDMSFMRATASADEIEKFRLISGDVLITKDSESWDDIGVPAFVQDSAHDLICGYHLALLRPISGIVIGEFLHQALSSRGAANQLFVRANGVTRFGLSQTAIQSCLLAIPPTSEQAAIARFLDHATSRIERYIRAKEKLIELLEEQKQIVVHDAVTGRIDLRTGQPYPAYKPSGVDYVGEIPEEWNALSLQRLTLGRCDGPFGSGLKSSHYTSEGTRVIRLQNIGHGEFDSSDAAYISADHYATLGDHSVEEGDVLIAGLGDSSHPAGRACVAPTGIAPAMVKADCFRFRLNRDVVEPQFLAFQLTATAPLASGFLSTGATRQRVNLQRASARVVGMPSLHDQFRIVDHVITRSRHIQATQRTAKKEISLLYEYRTRLIADAVTGKLDVREAGMTSPEDSVHSKPKARSANRAGLAIRIQLERVQHGADRSREELRRHCSESVPTRR